MFTGDRKRSFAQSGFKFAHQTPKTCQPAVNQSRLLTCKYWSVVTTIFPPSDAILQQAAFEKWCIVIVLDKKTKVQSHFLLLNYSSSTRKTCLSGNSFCIRVQLPYIVPSRQRDNVVVLSVEDQLTYAAQFPELIKALPWNHFGRKNVCHPSCPGFQ